MPHPRLKTLGIFHMFWPIFSEKHWWFSICFEHQVWHIYIYIYMNILIERPEAVMIRCIYAYIHRIYARGCLQNHSHGYWMTLVMFPKWNKLEKCEFEFGSSIPSRILVAIDSISQWLHPFGPFRLLVQMLHKLADAYDLGRNSAR